VKVPDLNIRVNLHEVGKLYAIAARNFGHFARFSMSLRSLPQEMWANDLNEEQPASEVAA